MGIVKRLAAGFVFVVGKDIGLFGRIGLFRVRNKDTCKQDLGNPA